MRYLYMDRGDHISMRGAHEHVIDPRDADVAHIIFPPFPPPIELEPGEVEFDHEPTPEELAAAFPDHKPKPPKPDHKPPDEN